MTLDASGNLGIGATSPTNTLHLKSETDANIKFEDTTSGTAGYVGPSANNQSDTTAQRLGIRGEAGVAFSVGSTTKMVLDSSGNVAIGTPSPAGRLHVANSSDSCAVIADGQNAASKGALFVFKKGGVDTGYIGQASVILGGGSTSNDLLLWADGAFSQVFYTNSVERARIPSTGGIQSVASISVGNATPTTSGAGITFPATQSDSSDPNTLDDYEQGTFSPTLSTSGTNFSSVTYIAQTGSYTKIGNKVYVEILLGWNALSGSPTGDLQVSGLPFTVNASAPNGTFATQCYFIVFPTLVPSATYATMQTNGSTTNCIIRTSGNNTDWTAILANAQATTGDHYIRASGSYTV
jgi:hypothetical protein